MRYLPEPEDKSLTSSKQVVASLDKEAAFTTEMKVGRHRLTADEPEDFGGNDFGPSPYALVSAGLAACTAMTLQLYAKRKEWDLQNVEIHISHGKDHAMDSEQCEEQGAKIDVFHREVKLRGNLNEDQRAKFLEIADKCPVHRTLHGRIEVRTKLADNS